MPERPEDTDQQPEGEENLVRDAWADARFSTEQALLVSGGGGLLNDGTHISAYELARRRIRSLLNRQLHDAALETALDNWIDLHRQPFECHAQEPVRGLLELLQQMLAREGLFEEFVRTVDMHHGQIMQERPIFQKPGDPPHPDDAYTFESVRKTLTRLVDACHAALKA